MRTSGILRMERSSRARIVGRIRNVELHLTESDLASSASIQTNRVDNSGWAGSIQFSPVGRGALLTRSTAEPNELLKGLDVAVGALRGAIFSETHFGYCS